MTQEEQKSPLHLLGEKMLADYFKSQEATNFIASQFEDLDDGQVYEITMTRIDGQSPLEQLQNSKRRIADLESVLKEILESPKSIHEDHELWRKAIKVLSNSGEQVAG